MSVAYTSWTAAEVGQSWEGGQCKVSKGSQHQN